MKKVRRLSLAQRAKLAFRTLTDANAGSVVYQAADTNRLLYDWITTFLTTDEEVGGSIRTLRARARDLARNNAYIRQYLNLLTVNVVGPNGFTHDAQVRTQGGQLDEATNEQIEAWWSAFASSPVTIDGKLDLTTLQHLLLKTVARDGEVFVRKWRGFPNRYGFALEPIDPDLIDDTYNVPRTQGGGREVRMGIEVDEYQRPVAYWLNDPQGRVAGTRVGYRVKVPAADVLHLYLPDRVQQARGLTWLHPVMVGLKYLGGYVQTELVAARAGAGKMGFFTNADGTGQLDATIGEDNGTFSGEPGTLEVLPPGYRFEGWNPDHPSAAFPAFVKTVLREIATGLGVSYNALANDLEGVNYSSMRSGLLIERDMWRTMQAWWMGAFLKQVYREAMNVALLTGAVKTPRYDIDAYVPCKFTPRGWQWVDPQKDANAGILAMQHGLASHQQLCSEQGLSFEEILEELADEAKWAKAAGVTLGSSTSPPSADAEDQAGTDGGDEEDDAAAEDRSNGNGHARGGPRRLIPVTYGKLTEE